MKRLLLILLIPISCCLTAWGQIDDDCSKGNEKPQEVNDPTKEQVGEATSSWQLSYDPNEIIGPEGYDTARWVSIKDVLNYTILFENDPEFATAAAQKVDVRFDFPNKAWMKGFGIGGYSFSNMSWTVAKPSNAYQQRIDLKDSLGYYVDLIAGLDVARQQGFWTFTTIDPETGYAPWQAEMGLLPVNDSTHMGEGAVTFQLKPYEGLHTGDTISIQASIVFDQNDTIPTNRWTNKIDAGMPESKLTAETHPTRPNVYNLKFNAKDDEGGSAVRHILLYMANHNGIYEEIDTVLVDSILAFPIESGKQYKLYSIAVDNTGNRETAKMEPDVILNFNQAPTDIALSDTIFQDDLEIGGFVGKLTSVDSEDERTFTYALAEGEGAIHNDLFQITNDQLQIKKTFKCAEDSVYRIRISTTDDGGLSFSKAFVLKLTKVLDKPKVDTLSVTICEGESCIFHGTEYDKTGFYTYSQSNDYMCDSVFVLNLTVAKILEAPIVTVEDIATLVSSAQKGNQWFREDGTPIQGANEQKFTPTEDGIYYVAVSNGSCFSNPSQAYQVKLSDHMDLKLDLKAGWNWVSSNLSEPSYQDAKQFLQPIESIVYRFVGAEDELVNDLVYGLTGGLTSINPTESYKLNVKEDVDYVWSGNGCQPETTSVSLHKGWNWMGYVPTSSKSLEDALSNLQPSDNDIVKCMDDFATFTGGKWVGTLTFLKPGEGYMYYATNAANFHYPVTRVFPVMIASAMMAPLVTLSSWNYDSHQYPDNTTLIAELYANDIQALEGAFAVGAFKGDECRGIGKYVDGKLFLTVHGSISDDKTIRLKAYEQATGKEFEIDETFSFKGQHLGTFTKPMALHVSDATGIDGLNSTAYTVYPRPLRNTMYIKGDTENIKNVLILTSDGTSKISEDGYSDDGIDVSRLPSGVYVVAIITQQGKVHYEKVLKAQTY